MKWKTLFLGAVLPLAFAAGKLFAAEKLLLEDRVKQLASEKKKIAVYMTTREFTVAPMSKMAMGGEEGPAYAPSGVMTAPIPGAYQAVIATVATELNKAFGTDIFKALGEKDVPAKTEGFLQVPNWNGSGYYMLVQIALDGKYNPKGPRMGSPKNSANFSVTANMYISGVEGKKMSIIDRLTVLAYPSTSDVKFDKPLDSYADFVAAIGPDTALAEQVNKDAAEKIRSVAEKLKKKKL